jgi:hypothetical protein
MAIADSKIENAESDKEIRRIESQEKAKKRWLIFNHLYSSYKNLTIRNKKILLRLLLKPRFDEFTRGCTCTTRHKYPIYTRCQSRV